MQTVRSFVGMDVHKETISISVAEEGRNGPVRFLGVIPNQPDDIAKMAKRLAKHGELDFCYEAAGCGYNIYRQLTALGHNRTVAATSLIPRKPGERIKTDRRDSQKLAILHRSGDLTRVWCRTPRTKLCANWSVRESLRRCTSCALDSNCSRSCCDMAAHMGDVSPYFPVRPQPSGRPGDWPSGEVSIFATNPVALPTCEDNSWL